jgi:formate/nitrite transporter FocA (FNT family)
MFYFGAANMLNVDSILYLCVVILGNAVGGMLFPFLDRFGSKK